MHRSDLTLTAAAVCAAAIVITAIAWRPSQPAPAHAPVARLDTAPRSPSVPAGIISFVNVPPVWTALHGRAADGILVFDLEGLDSAEAAVTLAQNWRDRTPADQPLECWLRPVAQERAMEAAALLAQQLCAHVRVALPSV